MVLTEEQDTTIYVATMEPRNAAIEDTLFNNVSTTQVAVPTGFEPSSGTDTSNHYVSKLFGGTGGNRVGPSIVLKVMARDTISANVFGWYQGAVQPPPSNEVPLVNDLLTSLSNDVAGAAGKEGVGAIGPVSSALSLAMGSFITSGENPVYVPTQPKAFINWVLFDDQMNYVSGSSVQVPLITAGMAKQVMQANLPATITQNGYLYIYVSNESQDTVFFDNLDLQYRRGAITEEEHYYPFGLTMTGISDRALQFGKYNKYRFNGGNEEQSKEFSDGSGLELYDANYRMLDPQIGRSHQIDPLADIAEGYSPYAFACNNPLLLNDPWGLTADTNFGSIPDIVIVGPPKHKPTDSRVTPKPAPGTDPGSDPGSGSGTDPGTPTDDPSPTPPNSSREDPPVELPPVVVAPMAAPAALTAIGVLIPESFGKEPYMGPGSPYDHSGRQTTTSPPGKVYEQYTLRATKDGAYPKRSWGLGFTGVTWLKKGDIYKIGTTSRGMKRYVQSFYENTGSGLRYLNEFTGTKEEVEFLETMKLINYAIQNGGEYPPGNSKLQ